MLDEISVKARRWRAGATSGVSRRAGTPVATPYGPVRVKIGVRHGRDIKAAPEYEDCRAIAERQHVPLPAVYAAAWGAAAKLISAEKSPADD